MKARPLPPLMNSERAAIVEYVARIHSRFPDLILDVVLFGSKARGDADAESDIDLLVVVDAEKARNACNGDLSYPDDFRSELWRIAFDVSLDHNVVLSPRVFDRGRWAEARRIRLPLYRAIAADGILLPPARDSA